MNDSSTNNRRQGIVRAQRVVDDVEVIATHIVCVVGSLTPGFLYCLYSPSHQSVYATASVAA